MLNVFGSTEDRQSADVCRAGHLGALLAILSVFLFSGAKHLVEQRRLRNCVVYKAWAWNSQSCLIEKYTQQRHSNRGRGAPCVLEFSVTPTILRSNTCSLPQYKASDWITFQIPGFLLICSPVDTRPWPPLWTTLIALLYTRSTAKWSRSHWLTRLPFVLESSK